MGAIFRQSNGLLPAQKQKRKTRCYHRKHCHVQRRGNKRINWCPLCRQPGLHCPTSLPPAERRRRKHRGSWSLPFFPNTFAAGRISVSFSLTWRWHETSVERGSRVFVVAGDPCTAAGAYRILHYCLSIERDGENRWRIVHSCRDIHVPLGKMRIVPGRLEPGTASENRLSVRIFRVGPAEKGTVPIPRPFFHSHGPTTN